MLRVEIDIMPFSTDIKALLKANKINILQLSNHLGIHRVTASRILNNPDNMTIGQLTSILELCKYNLSLRLTKQ